MTAIASETDCKMNDLYDRFIRASNENCKQIEELTENVIFLSNKYEDQRKIYDNFIGKIVNLNKCQFFLKNMSIVQAFLVDQAPILNNKLSKSILKQFSFPLYHFVYEW